MPGPAQVDRDETVQHVPVAVGEPLVTQSGRDALGPQQCGQQVRLGVTQADPRLQDLARGQRHPRIVHVVRVRDPVPHPLEGSAGEGRVTARAPTQLARERADGRVRGRDVVVAAQERVGCGRGEDRVGARHGGRPSGKHGGVVNGDPA